MLNTQHQTKILPSLAFLNDLCRYCLDKKNHGSSPKINKIYLQGGRYSGKSFNVRDILTTLLCSDIKMVAYINRKLVDDCMKDYQTLCDDMKIKFGEEFFANNFNLSQKPNYSISFGKYNKIIFEPLNEERHKQEKGGKLSARTGNYYDYIFIFCDEANQVSEHLYNQFRDTTRGLGAKKIEIFASNPGNRGNWYIDKCCELLPEKADILLNKGYQFDVNYEKGYVIWRGNYRVNKFIIEFNPEIIESIESYKETDYNTGLIVSLGLCGSVSGQLYIEALTKSLPATTEYAYKNDTNYMGIDYGYSRSKCCAVFGSISIEHGVDILDEGIHENEEIRGQKKLTRDEMVDEIIVFAKKQIMRYRKRIIAYVDNGFNDDMFYEIGNSRLEKHGLNRTHLEFFPAEKPKVSFRVDVINIAMGLGIFRISTLLTPNIFKAFQYCHRIEKTTRTEDDEFKRSHQGTDEINAVEYLISNNGDYLVYSNKKLL